jgi:molecular chaperone DnaK (HSP70)
VADEGACTVDLANMTNLGPQDNNKKGKSTKRSEDEITINKSLISNVLCKDIYDWSLAHIEKAIHQADVSDRDVDEIIIIGGPNKMPGFYEYLKKAYPDKHISFVSEDELAVGAAIVV